MQITLNWINRNVGEEGTRIFRAEAPLNPLSLPPPLATVGPGVSTYADAAAVQNVTYYYRTEIFKGADKILSSADTVITGRTYSGVGPQTIATGNSELGFYGEATGTDFLTYAQAKELCGLTPGTLMRPNDRWLKFAYKGKILMVPKTGICIDITWKMLYDAGLVYGVDGPGADLPSGVAPVNQNKIVVIKSSEYRVRLLKGIPPAPNNVVASYAFVSDTTENLTGSEWNDLFYRLSARTDLRFAPANRFKSIDNGLSAQSEYNSFTYCQERAGGTSSTQSVLRGYRHPQYNEMLYHMGALASQEIGVTVTARVMPLTSSTITFPAIWRPVFELIV